MYPAVGPTDLQSAVEATALLLFLKRVGGFLAIITLYKEGKLICQMAFCWMSLLYEQVVTVQRLKTQGGVEI